MLAANFSSTSTAAFNAVVRFMRVGGRSAAARLATTSRAARRRIRTHGYYA